jgi:hypothetical protein
LQNDRCRNVRFLDSEIVEVIRRGYSQNSKQKYLDEISTLQSQVLRAAKQNQRGQEREKRKRRAALRED